MVLLRIENISSVNFSGFQWKEYPMSREEFLLVMSSHKRWNEVESKVSKPLGRGYLDCIKTLRKQNVVLSTENMRFEGSSYSILLPNTGPHSPSANFSLSCDNDGIGAGLFETMTEIKRYVAEFERARIHWDLVMGKFGMIKGEFERFIGYGRTMDMTKVRRWCIPTSDSASLESFATKMETLKYVRDNESWAYHYSQQKLICKLIREASHCYPGVAVQNVEFVQLVEKQLTRALLKQITLFVTGEYTFDEQGPLDEICALINEFHYPAYFDSVYPTINGPKSKPELKLPIVTTVLSQGSSLPINFVNLKAQSGDMLKRGGIILNMETRTLVTDDFKKYSPVFDYTKKTNTLTGRITDEIMAILQSDAKFKILENPDFIPMDMSPLVRLPNPFPVVSINDYHVMTQSPEYREELIPVKK